MEKEETREWLHDAVKILILFWSGCLLTLSYIEFPPDGKKILDFDPTFIASVFSASTASLGLSIGSRNNGNVKKDSTK
tara:strand:- start:132 stop:365 length:234 start_codon:yes stop_codon:yes gene_type:complete